MLEENRHSSVNQKTRRWLQFAPIAVLTILVTVFFSSQKLHVLDLIGLDWFFGGINFRSNLGMLIASIITAADILFSLLVVITGKLLYDMLTKRSRMKRAFELETIASSPAAPQIEDERLRYVDAEAAKTLFGITDRQVNKPAAIQSWENVAGNLNKRIAGLQTRATVIYWTIVLVLLGGVMILIFAGYLTSFDSQLYNLWGRLDSTDQVINDRTTGVINRFLQGRNFSRDATSLTDDDLQKLSNSLASVMEPDRSAVRTQKEELFKAQIEDMKKRNDAGRSWNWSSSILRISVISLLIFLIQILMQLYRYNSRLIAFYGSRRDALMISAGDAAKTELFAKIFMPSGLDFGRQPNSPLLEIGRFWPWRRVDQPSSANQSSNGKRSKPFRPGTQSRPATKPGSVAPDSGTRSSQSTQSTAPSSGETAKIAAQ